jgi:hypothetical protein
MPKHEIARKKEIYERFKQNPKNIRFDDLCKSAEIFGFSFKGGKGSHRIYIKNGIREMLNFQNVKGKAKPYQVKQFLNIVDKYRLLEEDNE